MSLGMIPKVLIITNYNSKAEGIYSEASGAPFTTKIWLKNDQQHKRYFQIYST